MTEEYLYQNFKEPYDRGAIISIMLNDVDQKHDGMITSMQGDGYIANIIILYYFSNRKHLCIDYFFADGTNLEERTFWTNFISHFSKKYLKNGNR
ncbi:hypothetical protein ACG92U_01880 [Leuconostoc citreum]|uniref:hypothetical protein n=1 Tax=Leuconostoc citreum TaxID=33964 RepID=UPI0011704CFA|nr:hypothetical protein [Leuconostoc citreum]GEK60994.1 hypothetical protein LCI01_06300 [Leuconostoc citreum]